jgi:hypothetical protein
MGASQDARNFEINPLAMAMIAAREPTHYTSHLKTLIILAILAPLSACVSTPPTPIGGDSYFAQKSTAGGEFGNTAAALGHLIASSNKFCVAKGLEFQLVSQKENPSGPSQPIGGASITFKCVAHSTDPATTENQ